MKTVAQADTGDSKPQLTGTEHQVAELWTEVLQTSQPPEPDDDFFALGGNSMTMVMLEYRLQEQFSIEFPAGVLLGAPTLRELSALVDAELSTSRNAVPSMEPADSQ